MKELGVYLTPEDIDTIYESLCESDNIDVADSVLTDLFLTLSKHGKPILVQTQDDICDFSDIGTDDEVWTIDDEQNDGWSSENEDDEVWSVDGGSDMDTEKEVDDE